MLRLIAVAVLLAVAAAARADEIGDVVEAVASSTAAPVAEHAVTRLFDQDDATIWCAKEKVHVSVTVKLSRETHLDAVELSLGDPMGWKASPRVKQVFVSVLQGDRVMKKIRHKWPDHAQSKPGKVNLDATGDGVVIDVDQVYAGTGLGGLCLAGVRFVASDPTATRDVDAAGLAADGWSDDQLRNSLSHAWKIATSLDADAKPAELDVNKRGTFAYRDATSGLTVDGKWVVAPAAPPKGRALQLTITRARVGRKAVTAPAGATTVGWRFAPAAEGDPPTFAPWFAFGLDENGAVVLTEPQSVRP